MVRSFVSDQSRFNEFFSIPALSPQNGIRAGAFLLTLLITVLSLFYEPTELHSQLAASTQRLSAPANPAIQFMVSQVSKDTAMAFIRKLESYGTRYELSPQRDTAATYIINTMKRFGVTYESDTYTFSQADYFDLEMVDQANGWLIGQDMRDHKNFVFRTSDGGLTWVTQPTPNATSLSAVDFVSPSVGWIVGSGGGVFKTTDIGSSWLAQASGTTSLLLDVNFANNQLGFTVGEGGTLLRTANGGITWTAMDAKGADVLRKCKLLDAQRAWIVGGGGKILSTHDGGLTWAAQNSGVASDLGGVDFADSVNGWAVGSFGALLKTTNGGGSWSAATIPSGMLRAAHATDVDIVMLSVNSVIVLMAGELWKSDDGGGTWRQLANLGTNHLKGLGGLSVASYGGLGGINKSKDGGVTWQAWDQSKTWSPYATSRNCVATLPGSITPEKEYIIVAHYDGPLGNVPGADDNGSGVGAALEALRILKDYKFESTIRVVLTSAKEIGLLGSRWYANSARAKGRDIRLALNLDMIGYPIIDPTRLVLGSYQRLSPFVDSILAYKDRYGTFLRMDPYADSVGEGDTHSFAFSGYETLHISEGTSAEILAGNPNYLRPTDTSDKLNQEMIRRTSQLIVATAAELARPVGVPQKSWSWKIPFDRWNNLRSLSVVDSNIAFSSGDYGTLVRTTNGGQKWTQIAVGTSITLRGVSFIDTSKGVVVGDQGTIMMTTNGGKTWTSKSYDVAVTFSDVCLVDRYFGVAVGSNGSLYQTYDGGITWAPQYATPLITLNAVTFIDRNNGIFVGSSGTIFRTTDGGVRWNRALSSIEGYNAPNILDVCMVDLSNGYAVGEFGLMLRTSDGGASWSLLPSVTRVHLRGVHFADSKRGFAVGDGGLILETIDGGSTWSTASNGSASWFSAVRFATPNKGYSVGSDGMLIRTTDGGTTWTSQTGGPRVPLYAVRFTDALKGVVVGYQGSIYRTIDGGVSWEAQVSGTTEQLRGIEFPTASTGIVVGDNGTILRSTDAGITWQYTKMVRDYQSFWFKSIAFSSPTTGIIVGRRDDNAGMTVSYTCIMRTTDGGLNWDEIKVPGSWRRELMSVSFGGLSTVHAVGDSGFVLSSTNGGVNWFVQGQVDPETGITPPTKMNLKSVSFAGPSWGFAVGEYGTVLRTLDGGTTWTVQKAATQSNLMGVWTVNGLNILAVGLTGAVLVSNDAGATWIGQATETSNDLYAVHFTDVDRGTIVGDRGIILRTLLASSLPSGVLDDPAPSVPRVFSLAQNYPNPFNGMTTIEFDLARTSPVVLKLYDLLGREMATLVDEVKPAGVYRLRWDSRNLPSGVYFYRLSVGDLLATKKMVLLK